jgi:hypothetical protein
MGLPFIAGHFMFNLLKNMNFQLVAGFGTSSEGYANHQKDGTGQGILQGSSSAAPIYLLTSDVSLSTYSKIGTGATFTNPITNTTITDTAVQFANDTSQFLNLAGIQTFSTGKLRFPAEPYQTNHYSSCTNYQPTTNQNNSSTGHEQPFPSAKATKKPNSTLNTSQPTNHLILNPSQKLTNTASNNAQHWADILRVSGGQLNLDKCFCYAVQPQINYKKIPFITPN